DVFKSPCAAAHEVLSALPAQLQSHDEHKESFTFLEAFCQDKSLLALIKALLTVHDAVAWKEFEPTLPPFTVDLLEDSESVKVVQLVKNREPLGATIKRHEVTGEITVARIMHGGAAHRSGLLRVGDELKEVNGVRVDRKEPKEVTRILSRGQDYITLKIIPALKVESESAEKKIFLRALCEYKPADDPAIPCSEAGLAFRCGDVLEVMSQDDPTWWQARHMGKSPACAGLIPSQAFMGRRLESRRRASTQTAHGNSKLFPCK
uniref:MAGUK p55 subfamily member 7 n=1 Tax=Eptatretus burgeri TaxID=7764 RepID=A0A8C4QVT4_EPTBU